MKRTALILAVILSLVFSGAALSEVAQMDDSGGWSIPLKYFFEPYNSYMVDWADIIKSEESKVTFTAGLARDASSSIPGNLFDQDDIQKTYVTRLYGIFPSAVYYTSNKCWIISPMVNKANGLTMDIDVENAALYNAAFQENQIFSELTEVDKDLLASALKTVILSASDIYHEEGYEGIFRKARTVSSMSDGWIRFAKGEYTAYINEKGDILADDWNYSAVFNKGYAVVYRGKVFGELYPFPETDDQTGKLKGNYGLIDQTGKYILPLEYKSIDVVDANVASVRTHDGNKLFYNIQTGESISMDQYDYVRYIDDGIVSVFYGSLSSYGTPESGKYGLVSIEGEELVEAKYDHMGSEISDGLIVAGQNGKQGIINTNGEVIVPFTWDSISDVSNGTAIATKENQAYLISTDQGVTLYSFGMPNARKENDCFVVYTSYDSNDYSLLDKNYEVLLSPEWESIDLMNHSFYSISQKDAEGKSMYGIFDAEKKQIVVPVLYEDIPAYSSPTALIQFRQSGYIGYMDDDFSVVIPPQFEEAEPFFEDYAPAKTNGKWSIIDREGKIVY